MIGMRALAAVAAAMTFASTAKSHGTEGPMVVAFFSQQQSSAVPDVTSSIPRGLSSDSERKGTGRGGIEKQIASVSIGCLKPELTRLLREASSHFGANAVITSGYRPGRHSYHGRCMAADVQIPGVAPRALARWFRAQPGVGGVGTYGHTRSVHVDVAPRQYSWHHGRRKRYAASRYARA
jgi:hypothetical protein